MPPKIVVLGSINVDLVVRSPRLPRPGETLLGGPFATHPGGKGANQAVAAARLGAEVSMIACVGEDEHGRQMRVNLEKQGIDTSFVRTVSGASTGVAMITVEDAGENTIVVSPGANALVSKADVEAAMDIIRDADVVLCQLEVPIEAVRSMVDRSADFRATLLLNVAPSKPVDRALLARFDGLILNETEARANANGAPHMDALALLRQLPLGGEGFAVLTLGASGSISIETPNDVIEHAAFRVEVVDTTAAGDAFCAALAVRCAELGIHPELKDVIPFASAAGALACTRHGAQPSLPTRAEVESFLSRHRAHPN